MRNLLFLLCVLGLSACSKSEEEAVSLVREIPVSDSTQAMALTSEAKLLCQDPANCPANVGLYLAQAGESVLSCTSFLIAPDLVVTNSHCLPSAVKSLPDLCADRIQILFPASGEKPEERIACKELLVASARPNAISPDLALIRLEKKTDRAPIPVSRDGINSTQTHRAFKINPGSGASGTLVAQDCTPATNSYRFPLFKLATDPIFLVGDCPSQPGNSGAPLLNPEGKVVGLFQADLALNENQRKAWSPHLLPGEIFSPLALGTNLGCLGADLKWNSACAPIDEEEIVRPRIADFDAAFAKALPELPSSPFSWERIPGKTLTLEREETLAPVCILPADEWIGEFSLGKDEGFEQETSIELELPLLKAKVFFNRYMQTSAKLEVTGFEKRQFGLEPQKFWDNKLSLVTDGADTKELQACPTEER